MMRVVSPYRPCPPVSASHRKLGPFDWIGALRMLADSVRQACDCETIALTDDETSLPVPALAYPTKESALMLWILEISIAYLDSANFDRDTVFVSPDSIICGDLRPYFAGDLTVLIRSLPKYHNRPLLNSVQWWPVAAKPKLIAFYRAALDHARRLSDRLIEWGADSESLRQLLDPLQVGVHPRAGLRVSMREASTVLLSITTSIMQDVERGQLTPSTVPIVDFKGPTRKHYMARYFQAMGGLRCA